MLLSIGHGRAGQPRWLLKPKHHVSCYKMLRNVMHHWKLKYAVCKQDCMLLDLEILRSYGTLPTTYIGTVSCLHFGWNVLQQHSCEILWVMWVGADVLRHYCKLHLGVNPRYTHCYIDEDQMKLMKSVLLRTEHHAVRKIFPFLISRTSPLQINHWWLKVWPPERIQRTGHYGYWSVRGWGGVCKVTCWYGSFINR